MLPYNRGIMKALDCRVIAAACVPLVLVACPSDDTSIVTDSSNASSSSSSSDATTEITPSDTSTGPGAMTSTGPALTSSSSGTTQGVDDSSSGDSSDGPLPGSCGNNLIEAGEICDLNQLQGETCQTLGFEGGQLGCLLTCDDYNLLGCFICGNEVIDMAEECEGEVPEETTCESLGFEAGWITCGNDCLFDLSECSLCGDGIRQGPEQCDGIDFGGETCSSIGFESGNLQCNLAECAYVYSGCEGGTYTQDFEGFLDVPPEFDVSAAAPWFVDTDMPINGTESARSGNLIGGGNTDLVLNVSFPADGTLTFTHREDTAAGWDFLQFYFDGVEQMNWSGATAAADYMMPIPAGDHELIWRFQRAGFIDSGLNSVWVDDIILEGGVPL